MKEFNITDRITIKTVMVIGTEKIARKLSAKITDKFIQEKTRKLCYSFVLDNGEE
jgi:hypothetical protein